MASTARLKYACCSVDPIGRMARSSRACIQFISAMRMDRTLRWRDERLQTANRSRASSAINTLGETLNQGPRNGLPAGHPETERMLAFEHQLHVGAGKPARLLDLV